MECVPCGEKFSDQEHYEQHIESEKHKKKIINYTVLISHTGASSVLNDKNTIINLHEVNYEYCDICDITFNSHEDYKKHSRTLEHARKILEQKPKCGENYNIVSSSDLKLNGIRNETQDVILNNFQKNNNIQFSSFSSCDLCDKQFSGHEPYRQHLESAAHLKKVNMQKPEYQNTFSCKPCDKTFTGKAPYNQHMASERHKKKVQNFEFRAVVDSSSGIQALTKEENIPMINNNNNDIRCDICNIFCSGIIPYQSHLRGIPHLKKVRQKNASLSEDSIQLTTQQFVNGENRISCMVNNEPQFVKAINQQLTNENMETDNILPELMDDIKAMSTDELQDSIKVFLPNEDIDFDKLETRNAH